MGRIKTIIITIFLSASSFLFAEWDYDDSTILSNIKDDTLYMKEDVDYINQYLYQNLPQITGDTEYIRQYVYDLYINSNRHTSQFSSLVTNDSIKINHLYRMRNSLSNIVELLEAQNLDSTDTNILEQLSSFREDFNEYFDTSQTHLYDYFNQVYEGVDGKGGLLTIDDRLQQLIDTQWELFNIWYPYYTDDSFNVTLGMSLTNNVTKPLIDVLSSLNLTNNVDLSQIITNQFEQIAQFNNLNKDFLGIEDYTLMDYFDTIRFGHNEEWEDSSIKGVVYHMEELGEVLHSITNLMETYQSQNEPEVSDIISSASEYISSGDYLMFENAEIADTSYSYLTNVSAQAEITQIEYDFSNYTNVSDVISNIKNDSYYTYMMSETNQFVSASSSVTEALNKQVQSIQPLFERTYNSTITIDWDLLDVHNEIDLADYVTFDSGNLKLCWDFVIWISTILFGLKALKGIWEN